MTLPMFATATLTNPALRNHIFEVTEHPHPDCSRAPWNGHPSPRT